MTAGDTALRVDRLERRFGDTIAVDALSFDVRRGELFGLLGPDGAGKTTILRMLAGVLPPTSGDATLLGASVVRDPESAKHALAYMSQRFGLYADLTVRENLDFYADLYRVPKEARAARLERLFRFSNLEPFQDRLAGRLSGGMKQKLGLSCALVHEPEILLLDEPTFGVDPISRRDLWIIVHEMVARGVTAVVSTAYMDEAERFDRVALLDAGKIFAIDTPAVLQATLQGRVLALRAEPVRAAHLAAEGVPGVRTAALFGEWVHVVYAEPGAVQPDGRPSAAALAHLEAAFARAGVRLLDTRAIEASMEDVFIERLAARSAA